MATSRQPRRPAGRRGMSRVAFILAAMIASLLLTAVLAWQAFDAAASHRAVAQGVLRDYAALAGDEYIRRTANHVGYDGYFPLLDALSERVRAEGRLPTMQRLAEKLPPRSAAAPGLVASLFRIPLDPGGDALHDTGSPEVARWLREELHALDAERSDGGRRMRILHRDVDGSMRTFVYGPVTAPTSALVGFEVDRGAWPAWFAESFDDAPLLPPSLTRDGELRHSISITVLDDADAVLFRSGQPPDGYLASYRPFGDTYGGVFEGTRVIASIDPASASALVIGGLPGARLPLLAGLILLTLGLLIAAILLIRRERAVSQLRSEFVARVSHELRTPLTQIRMFAETLLLGRVRSDAERQRSLEIIDRESRRLTHLVENILLFSRGERGTMTLAPSPRNLAPLVRELVDEFEPLIQNDRIRIVTNLSDVVVPVDEDAFRQILLNLLDNAVKYGPAQQEIAVATERLNGCGRISVDDEGPGVPTGDRERIWRRFHRLDREQETASAGTGIGLAVVRELVNLHGGRAWVESGSRGGARFVLDLPLAETESAT